VKHVTQLLAERIGERVQISLTDMGGNLDILASLRGTDNLLRDLMDQPAEVSRCRRDVTAMWLVVYDELYRLIAPHCPGCIPWAPIWAPDRTYMLQSDFSYMISPAQFRKFVVPDLKASCDSLKYSFYHLDGVGQLPHLDQLLAIKNLNGVQWVSGAGKADCSEWSDVLAKIRDGGKLCQLFTTPQGALHVVRRHGGKGFLLTVSSDGMSEASARRFVAEIEGAQRPRRG
jgi:5-methyltetrahydrofolate--homocysteine methyltransferase